MEWGESVHTSYDCGILIKQIHDCLEKHGNNNLRNYDLTIMQMRVLMELNNSVGYTRSLKELEKEFNVAQPTMVGIIHRLCDKKFVSTYRDAADKRIKHVRMTDAGIDCCKDVQKHIDEMEAYLLSALSDDEQIQFKEMLLKVLNTVK